MKDYTILRGGFMREVPCDVPDIIGKRIVGVVKVVTSSNEPEKIIFHFNDGSKLVFGKEDGIPAGSEWVNRASVKYGGQTIESLLF